MKNDILHFQVMPKAITWQMFIQEVVHYTFHESLFDAVVSIMLYYELKHNRFATIVITTILQILFVKLNFFHKTD